MTSALLDPSESARRARPLRHWSKARQDLVRSQFAAIRRAWCADWLPEDGVAAHDADVLVSEGGAGEEAVSDGVVHWSFVDTSGSTRGSTAMQAVARAMFGTDVTATVPGREVPPIAEGVVRAAWNDWLQRIASSPALAGSELRESLSSRDGMDVAAMPWSGALLLRWYWCGGV
jgi:hypothetical protein